MIGAGASGMMAAIAAARGGASVTVLEAMERPGKKLLLTGNGKCNLTNMETELPTRYYGSGAKLAEAIIRRFSAQSCRAFFEELGLLTSEKNGYVYPYTAQSSSVLEVLLCELRRLKVKMKYSEKVIAVTPPGQEKASGWQVKTDSWRYDADAVILACGSKCLPSTGADGSGYALARALGHTVIPVSPALVPLLCVGDFLAALSGVRCRAKLSLMEEKSSGQRRLLAAEAGELQWTKYGISGIVVFQLSRFVSAHEAEGRLFVSIDLLPDFHADKAATVLEERSAQLLTEPVTVLLRGMLHEKLIPVVLKKSGIRASAQCRELLRKDIDSLVRSCKQFVLPVRGTKSFDECQVCAGGISCKEIHHETLESKKHRGLYFAGELLDIDGPCGGYNLQWAWSSGVAAGAAAAGCDDEKEQ